MERIAPSDRLLEAGFSMVYGLESRVQGIRLSDMEVSHELGDPCCGFP